MDKLIKKHDACGTAQNTIQPHNAPVSCTILMITKDIIVGAGSKTQNEKYYIHLWLEYSEEVE